MFAVAGGVVAAACSTGAPATVFSDEAPAEGAQPPAATTQISRLVTRAGNTHPAAVPENSRGPVEADFPLRHMQLVLKRSPENDAQMTTLIDALHDETSPTFHQWLTVEQFAAFSPSPAEIARVVAWLEKSGFTVDAVAPSRMFIEFSGTAATVKAAFHTEVHYLVVEGKTHIGNMTDPQIPAELADVVVGPHALHDFMPHPMHKARGTMRRDPSTGKWGRVSPDFTVPFTGQCLTNADCATGSTCNASFLCTCTTAAQCSATLSGAAASCNTATGTCVTCKSDADCAAPHTCDTATFTCQETFYAVAPPDFATIYNLNPLFKAGVTGKGQTVVVIEDTEIQNASDVATFRTAFGLSGYAGTFTQKNPAGAAACANPGVNGAEGEAALDAEWAGASAPDAAVVLAACADTTTTFGGLNALQNLINGNAPPSIVSISYGECESANGAAANTSFVNTYQQSAAMGVSVFVSAGDEGAASCDANRAAARNGIAVSGFASTPYNVAVGGTDFKDFYDTQNGGPALTSYWNATNASTFGSAKGYVPEIPWNDSCASHLIYSTPSVALGTYTQGYGATGFCNSAVGTQLFRTTGAGSGGPSNFSKQPAWQTGVVGLPTKSAGMRYLPDVSLFSADGVWGHFLMYCMTDTNQGGGPCTYGTASDALGQAAGGTSFAAPALAGIQALVNQKMAGPQGNPNYVYYKLAAAEHERGSQRCNSSGGSFASPVLPASECIFNDVTVGDIDVNCTGTTNCFGSAGKPTEGVLSTSTQTLGIAYGATPGWDFATGLGTVNAYNLVNAWSK